ncbi:MAG: septum formation family protein [Actinobacteria bacterium]|nr:septum formation family protein [Actinomycetota bacterium]
MKVVDLADEFGLTTSEAIDACLWAGVPADSSATDLTDDDAQEVRRLIASWIDAGFVPWRSQGEPHPGAKAGEPSTAPATGTAGGRNVGSGRDDGATKTLEPPSPRTPGGSEPPPDPAGEGPSPPAAPDADTPPRESSLPTIQPSSRGPLLPAARGGPTGWLPGGPDAQPRLAPLAIIALALAITSLVVPFVTAVLAIVLGSIAKDRIANSRGWQRGEKIATAAQVVAGVGMGLWLVLAVGELLVIKNQNTVAEVPDVQVDVATVDYDEAGAGLCVRLPRAGDIASWKTVACDQPHEAEVFATLSVSNAFSTRYPGDGPMQATAKADCRAKLAAYLAVPRDANDLEVGYAYPSAQTWNANNDRTIWCVLFRQDGTLLSDTLKNPELQVSTTTRP